MKPGDDFDGLLRAFFRGQMPHPWPTPRLPRFRGACVERPLSLGRIGNRSRWALAASMALLLLGSLFLSGRFTHQIKPGEGIEGPTLSDRHLHLRMEKEHKIKEHENKTGVGVDDDHLHDLDEFDLSPIK